MTAAHRQRACSLGDIDGGNEIGMVLETTLELATYCFNEGCHAITDHIIT